MIIYEWWSRGFGGPKIATPSTAAGRRPRSWARILCPFGLPTVTWRDLCGNEWAKWHEMNVNVISTQHAESWYIMIYYAEKLKAILILIHAHTVASLLQAVKVVHFQRNRPSRTIKYISSQAGQSHGSISTRHRPLSLKVSFQRRSVGTTILWPTGDWLHTTWMAWQIICWDIQDQMHHFMQVHCMVWFQTEAQHFSTPCDYWSI